MLDLTQSYQSFVPSQGPVPSVAPPPEVLSPSSVLGVCRCARVGPVAGSSPDPVVTSYGRSNCCGAIAAGRWVDGIKPEGAQPVCGRIASHVHGGDAVCV